MEKYNEYKDSGVAWLNQIPKNWQFRRVKDLTKIISKGTTPSTEGEAYTNTGVRFVKAQNVNSNGKVVSKPFFFISKETNEILKRSQLEANDLLLVIAGATTGKIAVIEESQLPANTNQAVCFLRLKNEEKKESLRYKYYYINSSCFQSLIWLYAVTSAQPNLPMAILGRIDFCYPPLNEQTQIANYLDAKTTAIDRKVNLLQQKIKLYKVYRKTLINETVTKGLDKTVKLKDSGISWIGGIPEHWEVKRLKSVGYISTSSVNKKIEDDEKIVSLVNYTDVYGNLNKEIWNNSGYMKVSAKPNQIIQKNLKKGDVLFTPSSETVEDIGVSSLVMEDLKNTLYSYHILRLRLNHKIYDNFKKYMFNNDFVQYYFSKSAKGTTRKILGLNDFNNLQVVLPPTFEEQQAIADYLDGKTATIDKIVKNIETQITTLKELRKTLINEVVTGKVKVSA